MGVDTDYPLIDSDPHFKRVIGYARKSDYVAGAATATAGPGLMLLWERIAPSLVGKGGFAPIMRLSGAIGLSAGFLMFYQHRYVRLTIPDKDALGLLLMVLMAVRFYGFTENSREVAMDMKEMVTKVKKGEPLYGVSTTTPYIQGMASRNSRYSGVWLHVLPWFNFVN